MELREAARTNATTFTKKREERGGIQVASLCAQGKAVINLSDLFL